METRSVPWPFYRFSALLTGIISDALMLENTEFFFITPSKICQLTLSLREGLIKLKNLSSSCYWSSVLWVNTR